MRWLTRIKKVSRDATEFVIYGNLIEFEKAILVQMQNSDKERYDIPIYILC